MSGFARKGFSSRWITLWIHFQFSVCGMSEQTKNFYLVYWTVLHVS